jgi:hypothetical protein
MQAPTYKEFRTWAYVNAYTPETLAPYVQADNPLKAAERVLVHLADTRWDSVPLPYPKLCQLYHGESSSETREPSTLAPRPFNQIPRTEVLDVPPLHRAWLNLWDAGWSVEKIATTWNQPPDSVEAILDDLSQQPLPPEHVTLSLPRNRAECDKRHQLLRELAERGWSQESLLRITGCYTTEVLSSIIGKPSSKASAPRKSRAKLSPSRRCICGCKKRLKGRQRYASDACRKKVTRQQERIVS